MFRPEEIARTVIKSFVGMANDKKLELKYTSENSFTALIGDGFKIKEIMNALVDHALRNTDEGAVSFAVNVIENQDPVMLQIKVTDTGSDIRTDQIRELFLNHSDMELQRKSDMISSSGHPLRLAKKMIDELKGKIEIKSEIGKGSEFIVLIPCGLSTQQSEIKGLLKTDIGELPPGTSILIADDTLVNVMLMRSLLKRENAKVDVAENGAEALRFLEINEYDLLVTDINMPVMDGLELTRQIRNHSNPKHRNLPIIALTGSKSQEAANRMKEAGINDFMYKPFKQKEFFELIRKNLPKG